VLLLTHVRRAIRLAVLKKLQPLDAGIESQRCAAWFAIRAAYPHVHTGQLERVINTGASVTLRRLITPMVSANDTTPAPLCSYPGAFPCGMASPDCERCAPREGSWPAVRASR
jgi:hypothetical protein